MSMEGKILIGDKSSAKDEENLKESWSELLGGTPEIIDNRQC